MVLVQWVPQLTVCCTPSKGLLPELLLPPCMTNSTPLAGRDTLVVPSVGHVLVLLEKLRVSLAPVELVPGLSTVIWFPYRVTVVGPT